MVGISFRFDLGRYHATAWGAHVNEGTLDWPPCPWRILRALYAVSRANAELSDARAPGGRAIERLARSEPPSYTLPVSTEAHTRHYLPSRTWSPAHAGRTDLVLDSFRAVSPDDELAVWWRCDLDDDEYTALSRIAATLGYLGRSESLCSASISRGDGPSEPSARPAAERDVDGHAIDLLCPAPDIDIGELLVSVADLRRRRLLIPPGTRFVPYELRTPRPDPARSLDRGAAPELAVFRLGGPNRPGFVETVAVAQSLRAALQSRLGATTQGASSPTLSGRASGKPRSDQHRHAHYLALSDTSRRRVERLAVWAPEGFKDDEVQALASLSRLSVRGAGDPLPLALAALAATDALALPELLGPARRWRSLTPFGLVRHPKRRAGELRDGPEDQLRLELRRRGFPEPATVALLRGSWHRFRSSRVGASRLQRARVFGMQVTFAEPVRGPLALGALSHFGLGLFQAER